MNDNQTGATPAHETSETDETVHNSGESEAQTTHFEHALESADDLPHRTIDPATAKRDTPDDLAAKAKAEAAHPITGFAAFRMWVNKAIRDSPDAVTLSYGETDYSVTELTHKGEIRLQAGERFVLLPFDERYCPAVLKQIL